jgi:hypothetical protein
MSRFAAWLRSLRLWFVDQRQLRAQVLHAEQETATVRADYEKELLALEALHSEGMAVQRKHIEELRVECQRWEEELAESERRRMAEVRNGNAAWQEAGIQRRRADRLQAEVARLSGVGVEHAAARD